MESGATGLRLTAEDLRSPCLESRIQVQILRAHKPNCGLVYGTKHTPHGHFDRSSDAKVQFTTRLKSMSSETLGMIATFLEESDVNVDDFDRSTVKYIKEILQTRAQ